MMPPIICAINAPLRYMVETASDLLLSDSSDVASGRGPLTAKQRMWALSTTQCQATDTYMILKKN